MKPILAILISFLTLSAMAQTGAAKPGTSGNCFKEWYTLFKERGANPIPDGTQDVIITVRSNDYSECFVGKIEVQGEKIIPKTLQIEKVDGSFGEFNKSLGSTYQNTEGTLKEELRVITNGMSATATLADGEIVRLFFYKYLADKPKANKKAPAPSSLIKN